MKKYIYGIFLFILGLFIVPKMVFAADIPKEGVHYFLTYPNGVERVIDTYEELEENGEMLIYSGRTNSNGEVVLNDLSNEGKLRIIQKVPTGYTTEKREVTLDLADDDRNVEFIDFKGISVNPKTGQSLLFLGVLAIVLIVAFKTTKNSKKSLMILTLIFLGLFAFKVQAEKENLVITIKDKEGNRLSAVEVEVYAEPISIVSAPAVKFNANGGKFFDGTELMYIKIPTTCGNPCTVNDFMTGLSEEESSYLWKNVIGAYRENYEPETVAFPDDFSNATVINIHWDERQTKLITIDGNGGYYDFHGKKLTSITAYNYTVYEVAYHFQKSGQHSIGVDDNRSCPNYTSTGMSTTPWNQNATTVYACWNTKPDGIYVNGNLFLGSDNTCYNQSRMGYSDSELNFRFNDYELDVTVSNGDVVLSKLIQQKSSFYTPPSITKNGAVNQSLVAQLDKVASNYTYSYANIDTMEIVKDGNVILSITGDDIQAATDSYTITNAEKKAILNEYFVGLIEHCFPDANPSTLAEETPGTAVYLYEDSYIELDGIGFEYVSFNANVLNVNVTINGNTKNYNITLGQETRIDNLKNPIVVEAIDDYYKITFR